MIRTKRLLNRAVKENKGFIDFVNPKFINECVELDIEDVVPDKKNYNTSILKNVGI